MEKHKEIRIKMGQLGRSRKADVKDKPLPVITLNINEQFFFSKIETLRL